MLAKDFDEPADYGTPLSVEDRRFVQLLDEQTVVDDDDGHYSTPLPLRPNIAELPQNRHVAMKRLLGLCGRFRKDQAYREEYTAFMQEMLRRRPRRVRDRISHPCHSLSCSTGGASPTVPTVPTAPTAPTVPTQRDGVLCGTKCVMKHHWRRGRLGFMTRTAVVSVMNPALW